MLCFYHSADFDGICSGAIVKQKYPDCYVYGINYGQDFPWDMLREDDVVFMCDFSLQPFDDMGRLAESVGEFIWIDHHASSMNDYIEYQKRHGGFKLAGVREVGKAGCELTWEYLYLDEEMPPAVHYLGRYDVWDHDNPDVLPFQYGMRSFSSEETRPYRMEFWEKLFEQDVSDDWMISILSKGKAVLSYMESDYERYANSYSFVTWFKGLKAIACNRGMTGSKLFNGIYDPEIYDIMLVFTKLPQQRNTWTVSLYTENPDIDCGAIAKEFGGGGHREAGGFQCTTSFLVKELFHSDFRPRNRESGE